MEIRKNIPNFLTSLNLACGTIGVVMALSNKPHYAAIMVLCAALLDFLDGFSARLLKAYSSMGKELDSLADLVSFGLVPATIIYKLMEGIAPEWGVVSGGLNILPFTAFIITIFSALRLAKFNIDTRQSDVFIGLPTPANALFFISFPIILYYGNSNSGLLKIIATLTSDFVILLVMTLISSFLLVSNIRLIAFKFKNYTLGQNIPQFSLLAIAIILTLIFGVFSLPLIIISYLIVSIISGRITKTSS